MRFGADISVSAWRCTSFHAPCSRRNTSVTRSPMGVGSALVADPHHGMLDPGPVGDVVAGRRMEDLEMRLCFGAEQPGILPVFRRHIPGALDAPAHRSEKGGRRSLGEDGVERFGIAAHIGARGVLAVLHEALEIVRGHHCLLLLREISGGPTRASVPEVWSTIGRPCCQFLAASTGEGRSSAPVGTRSAVPVVQGPHPGMTFPRGQFGGSCH